MNPVPPFIPNSPDDMHCVNAVFRMVLLHFTGGDMSWEDIDLATKAVPGKGTWTVYGDILLVNRGIKVKNIEPVDYVTLGREGVAYLSRVFGEETARYYLTRSNIEAALPGIPEFLRLVSHETRKSDAAEISRLAREGNLVGVTVNSRILNSKPGLALHYVLVYDFDGTCLHLHDPGLPPMPQRKVTLEEFERSFSYPGGNGGIEVFSR